jgi:hypothetical protein
MLPTGESKKGKNCFPIIQFQVSFLLAMLNRRLTMPEVLYHYHSTWITKVNGMVGQTADVSVRNQGQYLSSEDVVCGKIQIDF